MTHYSYHWRTTTCKWTKLISSIL